MRSQPRPFLPGKLDHPAPGMPQNVLLPPLAQENVKPVAPQLSAPSVKQVLLPLQPMRAPQGACFKCAQPGHFARECLARDQARQLMDPAAYDDQVN